MYNEELARRILEQLNQDYPERLRFDILKERLPEFSGITEQDWLKAVDALQQEGSVEGTVIRTGIDRAIQMIADLQITQAGRIRLRGAKFLDQTQEETRLNDPLLPIYSRAEFNRDLATLVSRATEQQPVALIMIDIDYFKSINDTYGHPSGDRVLVAVAEAVKLACGHKGHSYRYGGEELAVLLENYLLDEALVLAERIRSAISNMALDGIRTVTASMGVAISPHGSMKSYQQLVDSADKALYKAKHAGRNRVVAG